MSQKKRKASVYRRPAKCGKKILYNTTADSISGSFNETSYPVHPEADAFMPALSIPYILKILLVNNDGNHYCNPMDDIRNLRVGINILYPLKYLVNPDLAWIPEE